MTTRGAMSTKKPLVSVVMPVYNAEPYLKEAIDSILEQTYENFELLAINDGSKDNSGKIIDNYAKNDPRVKAVHQENTGIVTVLNRGIEMAKGEFIARMDSDDVSFPRRFEQQLAVFAKDPNVVLVAGGFEVIDEDGEFLYREVLPAHDRDLKRRMLLRNPLAHGSVMFRKSVIDAVGPYTDEFGPTEDFELWSRIGTAGKFVALEATIFRWRVNSAGITSNNNQLQLKIMKRHTGELWKASFPKVLSAKQLRKDSRTYFLEYKKRGVDMKNIMLNDNAEIAVAMIRRGHPFAGLHQLGALAISNRTGLKSAIRQIGVLFRGGLGSAKRAIVSKRNAQ